MSDYTKGTGWLFGDAAQGFAWDGFNPPLGWDNTLAYLVLPVALVASQYVSTAILTPKSDDPGPPAVDARSSPTTCPMPVIFSAVSSSGAMTSSRKWVCSPAENAPGSPSSACW